MTDVEEKYIVRIENELTLGLRGIRPESTLYCNNSGFIPGNSKKYIHTGISSISSEDKNVVFYVLGVNPTLENNLVETVPSFIGLDSEIKVMQINHSHIFKNYSKDDDLAKMVAIKTYTGILEKCDNLDDTMRGTKGFGSTGKL